MLPALNDSFKIVTLACACLKPRRVQSIRWAYQRKIETLFVGVSRVVWSQISLARKQAVDVASI